MLSLPRLYSRTRAFAITFLCASSALATPAPLPLETFYQDPALSKLTLSPDGKQLAGIQHIDGKTLVMVHQLDTGKNTYLMQSDNVSIKFNWLKWINDERLLLSSRHTSYERGLVFSETRLLSLNAKEIAPAINMYTPNEDVRQKNRGWTSQFQDNIVCSKSSEPKLVWIAVDRDMPNRPSVYRVNVDTGRATRVIRYRSQTSNWITDRNCDPRVETRYDDDTLRVSYRVLNRKTQQWEDAWSYQKFAEPDIIPLGFGGNPDELYLLADHQGYQAVFKADLSKPNFPKALVLSEPGTDLSGDLIYSEKSQQAVGIYLYGGHKRAIFWDTDIANLQNSIDKAINDSRNYILSLSSDERRYLIYSVGQKNPGMVLLGDRDKKTLSPIAQDYPDIAPANFPIKTHEQLTARDGVALDAIFSKPASADKTPLPTIVFPHGGPMSEDDTSFDLFSTYFTSRGYAVIQPNFRGSSGRGFDFLSHAVGGYGLAMQDDIEDTLQFFIKRGDVDAKRVCIIGASYGGYAALMGATKTPDLFKCAISFAGFGDLQQMHRQARRYVNKNLIRAQLGNEKTQLSNSSPINSVDKIKIPVLLIHGERDQVVAVDQSRAMANALKSAKKSYEYIELSDASHYLDNQTDRQRTFEAIDKFLQQHLPTR